MTLRRLAALNEHWRSFPPVHKSLARLNSAILKDSGTNYQTAPRSDDSNKVGTLKDLLAAFGQSGGQIKP